MVIILPRPPLDPGAVDKALHTGTYVFNRLTSPLSSQEAPPEGPLLRPASPGAGRQGKQQQDGRAVCFQANLGVFLVEDGLNGLDRQASHLT